MSFSKLLMGCAFASISLAANAADLPGRSVAKAPAPAAVTWTGFYLGATAGYNFFTNATSTARPNGALVGLRGGYDMQVAPNFVFGALVDGDINFGDKSIAGNVNGTSYTGSVKHRYTVSADLKGGYLINSQTMVYALGGYTHGEIKGSATLASVSASQSLTGNGWNVGLGSEYRFTTQWSGFAEYRYNQIKKSGATADVSQAKAGVAYRF